jgi:hypothetical protein
MKSRALIIILFAFVCWGADDDMKRWKHPEPIAYESIRAWHEQGGLHKYVWPKEHQADLNEDCSNEVFLGISGYSRGMTYALFTKTKAGWILLCDEIGGSHHPFEILPEKHELWHDFKAITPDGRGGLHEVIYTWNGRKFVEKSSREIREKKVRGE